MNAVTTQRSGSGFDSGQVTFVMGAWGHWHVDMFLSLCLPSLLSPRNLPAFVGAHRPRYVIFTTAADRRTMEQAPLWHRFAELVSTEFELLRASDIREPIATQQRIWSRAIDMVSRRNDFLFLMPPDVVWGEGSLAAMARALTAGCRIVFVPWHIRVVAETFVPAMRAKLGERGSVDGISGRDLVRLSLEHLHPLNAAYRIDGPYFPYHPEILLHPVRHQGLLARIIALTPALFRPVDIALNRNKLAVEVYPDDELYLPADSDELFLASLTPLAKEFPYFSQPRKADAAGIAKWWQYYASGSNEFLARSNYRIHFAELDLSQWRRAERRIDSLVRRATIARDARDVWQVADAQPFLRTATEILALAISSGLIARAIRGPGARLIVLPHDRAFTSAGVALETLLDWRRGSQLIQWLRAHVAVMADNSAMHLDDKLSNDLVTEAGTSLSLVRRDGTLQLNGRPVVGPPTRVGNHLVVVSDQLLMAAPR
ncbi:MAG: hypothetical protein IT537_22990 [Hyphomicrobiales bacterium]|nr:hypothetical protein [Hyphomicrobiales bacterium]